VAHDDDGPTASENRTSVKPAQTAPSAPTGPQTYYLGGSTLEFAPQPDGALSSNCWSLSMTATPAKRKACYGPSVGMAVWKNEEFGCELTFRWQGNAVKLDQRECAGLAWGWMGAEFMCGSIATQRQEDRRMLLKNYGLFWKTENVFWGRQKNSGGLFGIPAFEKRFGPR
jgi:hypothetical protein